MSSLKICRFGTRTQAAALSAAALAMTVCGSALAQNVTFQQVRNGQGSSVSVPTISYTNGNANATQAHFMESHSTSYRAIITGLTPGNNYWIAFQYETKQGGKHTYDFLTHYNRLVPHFGFAHCCAETIDPLLGLAGTFTGPSTFPIPAPAAGGDPVAPLQPTLAFNALPANDKLATLWNGTLTNISYISQGNQALTGAASVVRFDFTATSATAVLAFGAHIAPQTVWGLGNAASGIPGSSYHINIHSASFGASGQTLQLMAGAVIPPPSCQIAGPTQVCPTSTTVYTGPAPERGQTYLWSISKGTSCATFLGGAKSVTTQTASVVACRTCGDFTLNLAVTNNGLTTNCSIQVQVGVAAPIDIVSCPPNPGPLACGGSVAPYTTVAQFVAAGGVVNSSCAAMSITHQDVGSSGGCGTITRTYTITDACGNTDTCQQTITIQDTQKPVLAGCPASTLNIACLAAVPSPAVVTATDNCDGSVQVQFNESNNGGTGCAGSPRIITRTWTATDTCGNTESCTQTITVLDNVPPTIVGSCPPSTVNVACLSAVPAAPTITATDLCGSASVSLQETNNGGTGCGNSPRIITRVWTAQDSCGNSAVVCTQTITVQDNQPPVINGSCPPSIVNIACLADVPAAPTVTATDNCGSATVSLQETNNGGSGCGNSPRIITRTWTAQDSCGNSAVICTQTITVQDNQPPTILGQCPVGTINLGCAGEVPPPATVSATDNCSSANVTLEESDNGGSGCSNDPLIITRNYRATDGCGNSAIICTQTITIGGGEGSTITCPEDIDVECGGEIPDPFLTLEDFIAGGGSVSETCGITGFEWLGDEQVSEGLECPIVYHRTYRIIDNCGSPQTCVQVIRLVDNTPPVVCCVTPDVFGCVGYRVVLSKPTVTDECGMTITPEARLGGIDGEVIDVDTYEFPEGTNRIYWTAKDGCGNQAEAIVVRVIMSNCPSFATLTQDGWAGGDPETIALLLKSSLTVGRTDSPARSVTIDSSDAHCLAERLPAGTAVVALPSSFGNQDLDSETCNTPTELPLNGANKFSNALLGNTIALALNLRDDPSLGALKLCSTMTVINSEGVHTTYVIPESVLSRLGTNRTVDNLMALANLALAGRSVTPTNATSINTAVLRVNAMFNNGPVALLITSCAQTSFASTIGSPGNTQATASDLTANNAETTRDTSTGERPVTSTDSNATQTYVNSGLLAPAQNAGIALIEGNLEQTTNSAIMVVLRGDAIDPSMTRCDQVIVEGQATLQGTLIVDVADEYTPQIGDSFEIMTANSIVGEFEQLELATLNEANDDRPYLAVRYDTAAVMIDVLAEPFAAGDLNRDRRVDVADLLQLISEWAKPTSNADLNRDGTVGTADLLMLLGSWGS